MCEKTSLRVRQVSIIALIWMVAGALITCYDHLLLATPFSQGRSDAYSFGMSLLLNTGTGLIGALTGGALLVFYIGDRFNDKPYVYTVIAVALFFLVVVVLISFLKLVLVGHLTGAQPSFASAVIIDSSRLKSIMAWFIIVCLTQLFLQMSNRIGNRLMGSFFVGRYNVPREEEKVFMFLDLDSSTSIAERIGDERYHDLLRDFFADISNPVLESKGQIYQYVGDEVVVAWDYGAGVRDNRCISCFFDIKRQIQRNSEHYTQRYGFVPSFKAGFHSGKVIAGEVGTLKREITYSGDVLNTTSRMLGMCKSFGVEVITSGKLLSELCLDTTFEIMQLGSMKLHGKEKEIFLNAIRCSQ